MQELHKASSETINSNIIFGRDWACAVEGQDGRDIRGTSNAQSGSNVLGRDWACPVESKDERDIRAVVR